VFGNLLVLIDRNLCALLNQECQGKAVERREDFSRQT
jgi:hypothetical protein